MDLVHAHLQNVASRHETTARLLDAHRASDAKEARDLATMKRVLQAVASPFSRRSFPHHFTASAVIVDPARAHVLLVHHRRLDRWLQPGGHFGPDDPDPLAAALREAREETGLHCVPHSDAEGLLDVDVHGIPGKGDEPDHYHLDLRFLVMVQPDARIQADMRETKGARWFASEDLSSLDMTEELARLLAKAIDQRGARPSSGRVVHPDRRSPASSTR